VEGEAEKLAEARRIAAYWEREAVLRTTTVASSLAVRILAGRRFAEAVERLLLEAESIAGEARLQLQAAVDEFRALDR
jgi:hypothetical protein